MKEIKDDTNGWRNIPWIYMDQKTQYSENKYKTGQKYGRINISNYYETRRYRTMISTLTNSY